MQGTLALHLGGGGEGATQMQVNLHFSFKNQPLIAYCFLPSPPKLAVVSHLFKINHLKVTFGLLRDPSFLAARMGAVTYRFVF